VVLDKVAGSWFIVDSSVVDYDGARNLNDGERSVGRKKLSRKPEPKRRKTWPRWTGFGDKTLWDWMQLLAVFLIPIVIYLGGQSFEEQRSQDIRLEGYFDTMSTLMLEDHNDPEVKAAMQARTLTALAMLNEHEKLGVFTFLYEANLFGTFPLHLAKLQGIDLSGWDLQGIDLSDSLLQGANLSNSDLQGADLSYANLGGTDLSRADLQGANLKNTNLRNANLSRAQGWTEEQLSEAHTLRGATMPDGQILRGDAVPNGPTFEEWLKSQGRKEDSENE
jgi:hypothetical protein